MLYCLYVCILTCNSDKLFQEPVATHGHSTSRHRIPVDRTLAIRPAERSKSWRSPSALNIFFILPQKKKESLGLEQADRVSCCAGAAAAAMATWIWAGGGSTGPERKEVVDSGRRGSEVAEVPLSLCL